MDYFLEIFFILSAISRFQIFFIQIYSPWSYPIVSFSELPVVKDLQYSRIGAEVQDGMTAKNWSFFSFDTLTINSRKKAT